MLKLSGQIANCLVTPEGTNREGETYGGVHQVQFMCKEPLRNGETRFQMVTLRADDLEPFRKLQGRHVTVPVGCFVRGSSIQYYLIKGGTPSAAQEATA